MIRVEVLCENASIKRVSVLGHAMYDDFGKDIVCSSVSTCVITTVNGILSIDEEFLEVEENTGKIIIDVLGKNEILEKLLQNMIDILSELSSKYPKNIMVISKEGKR